jgi:hypothetical protein
MSKLTKEAMFRLVDDHIAYELERDIDGIMSTLCDEPYFEYHPMGYALITRDAIREKYRLSIQGVWSRVIARTETIRWWNEDSVVLKDVVQCELPGGRIATLNALAEFTFEGDKLKGEHVYCNGEAAEYQTELLKDFWTHPGVRKL